MAGGGGAALTKNVPPRVNRSASPGMRSREAGEHGWVRVSRREGACVLEGATGPRQVVADSFSAAGYTAHCLGFLRSPREQAAVDIPRSTVRVDGVRVRTAEQLEAVVPAAQLPALYALCTQVLFARPYELAHAGLAAGQAVVEDAPARPGYVELRSAPGGELGAVAPVVRLEARKRMRVMDLERCVRLGSVQLRVSLDLVRDLGGIDVDLRRRGGR